MQKHYLFFCERSSSLPYPSFSGEFIVYFVQYFNVFCIVSYYRSSGHVVSECWFALENIHFRGELIHLFTYTGIIITNLRFSFILYTKFFVSPRILTIYFGLFTNHSPGHVTIRSSGHLMSECGILLEIFISPVN